MKAVAETQAAVETTDFVPRLLAQAVVLGHLPLSVFSNNLGLRLLLATVPQMLTAVARRELPDGVADAYCANMMLYDRRRIKATIAQLYGEAIEQDSFEGLEITAERAQVPQLGGGDFHVFNASVSLPP